MGVVARFCAHYAATRCEGRHTSWWKGTPPDWADPSSHPPTVSHGDGARVPARFSFFCLVFFFRKCHARLSTLLLIVHICQCRSIACSLAKLSHLANRCLSPNVLSVHWHKKNHNNAKNPTEQMKKKLIRTKCTTKSYLQTMGVSRRSTEKNIKK